MRQMIFASAIVVLLCSTAIAQQIGDTIVVSSQSKAELKVGTRVVGSVPRGNHLKVQAVKGEWFEVRWIGWKGQVNQTGWVHRRDIIPIDQAIDFFTAAIKRNPTSDDHDIRGMIWSHKGEYDIAIADYNEAIRLDPKQIDNYNNRGIAWADKGEYDKAIADYNEAIRLDPQFPSAYNNRGNAWGRKGEYDKAIADYNEAIRINPKFDAPYNGLAWIRATCPDAEYRDGKAAVELARKACEMTDWDVDYHLDTLAASCAETGDFEEAVRWQTKAMELAPEDQKADYQSRLDLYKSDKSYCSVPISPTL